MEQDNFGKVTFEETYGIYCLSKSEFLSEIQNNIPTYKNVDINIDYSGGIPYINIKSDDSKHFHRVVKTLKKAMSSFFMTLPNQSFEKMLVDTLIQKKWTISCAESMTGGAIASRIIAIRDASQVIKESYVVYSNETKQKVLGVSEDTIARYGVVSSEVALEMVERLHAKTNANICISVTGIAGPTGGDETHPIGTVYIGLQIFDRTCILHHVLKGNRVEVQQLATSIAIVSTLDQLLRQEKKS